MNGNRKGCGATARGLAICLAHPLSFEWQIATCLSSIDGRPSGVPLSGPATMRSECRFAVPPAQLGLKHCCAMVKCRLGGTMDGYGMDKACLQINTDGDMGLLGQKGDSGNQSLI